MRLAELEARAEDLDRMRTSTISSIALINDRNRKNNILRAEQGIKAEVERARVEGHIDDPFTRRKTQPVLSVAKSKVIGALLFHLYKCPRATKIHESVISASKSA